MKNSRKNYQKAIHSTEQPQLNFYNKVELFFEKNQNTLFIISMICATLMCFLLFDVKVSLSGDDSDYILFADEFWHHFRFPGFRGPLYPIVLSPFIGIFGMNLVLLKSLSSIFILLSLWFLYKSFQNIVPAIVLIPAIFLTSICSYVFFYASYTYSEPFFMLLQSIFIFYFTKYFIREGDKIYTIKKDWSKYLLIGILALCMGLTRSIGYGVIGVVFLYFAFNSRWKDLLYTLSASVLVFFFFQLLKSIVWPEAGSAYDIRNYLAKDYYNLNLGMEDLPGFYNRFIENSVVYLSAFLCQFMGIIPETPNNLVTTSNHRTIIIYILYFICFFITFKKNKALLFIGLYVGIMNFISFVLLQSTWGQDRLIMIYYPYIILFFLGGIYFLFQIKQLKKFTFIYYILFFIVCFGTLSISKNRVSRNIPILQQNLLGNQLYGLTPDWQNFIKASQWVAKNTDADAVIASRKPSISKVYTGRDFAWTPTDLTLPIDSLFTLKTTNDYTIFVVDVSQYTLKSPFLKYIIGFATPFNYNNKMLNGAAVYVVPNEELDSFNLILNSSNLILIKDYTHFFNETKTKTEHRIFDPEMMLDYLIDSRIRYLLLPQLRSDPTKNTGVYINTVHRYIWFISYKYPQRFRKIHTVGKEEPCEIVEFIQ